MNASEVIRIHADLLRCWNARNANGMAMLFHLDANVIGFDGSQMNGRHEIEVELAKIFDSHSTAAYIWEVKEVRFLNSTTALLRAIVGMVPPGEHDIKTDVNAIQTLVASYQSNTWKIALFQNTPARFDGRPDLSAALTQELRDVLRNTSST